MNSNQLPVNEYSKFNATYIQALENIELFEELEISLHDFIKFVQNIPLDKFDYSYAEGKWTIKEIIQHIIDTERIFAYRALRISRNDKTPLPGFEENDYAPQANAAGRSLQKIASEMAHLRASTIDLFESFTSEMLTRKGTANKNELSVVAIRFIIPGHETHHRKILLERYLDVKA